ncbi:membrane protein [Azorhizobium oxalatiphilum]|uniref:Membrane protein n=1 Tax=Azorhizobium oxalatiphilum TaxID=980631 RepID=A0A917BSQ2_9HYPH|nr:FUSC family protein [Azorhizobium oxalatiphilum]GGF57329.1 membrane protein [Azorhizobium oxalatiphilum]
MKWPSWQDWLFSAKAYTAALLALYIGLAFSLPRPYWALTTVYVVSNPLSGVTGAKAIDRMLGTIMGCAGAVVIVTLFVNAPELMMLAVACWAGLLLFIALRDRTPRNYAFMLGAYTLPLVALPNVSTPEAIFDYAVSRSEEIIVAIVCASVVGALLFPTSVAPVLNARVGGWLKDAASWIDDILRAGGQEDASPATPAARQKLAADVAPLTALISQLGHDAGTRDVKRHAEELRGRLLFLLPILSSISDRLHALRLESGALPPPLEQLLADIAGWIRAPADALGDDAVPDRLRAAADALEMPAESERVWDDLVRASLLARLRELIDLWQDCLALQRQIASGGQGRWRPALRHRPLIGRQLHYDLGLILFAVGSTVAATFIAGLVWIWSGWSGGAFGVAFVAIACCFFGAFDRPAPLMKAMLVWSTTAYVITGLYLTLIMPNIADFEILALVLAPPFLLIGAFIPRPDLTLITLLLAASFAGDLGLQGRYGFDFASYVEGGIAITLGIAFAIVWTLITKPFGVEVTARRLVVAGWLDLAELAAGKRAIDHAALIARMLDRLAQLMPRVAMAGDPSLASLDGLAELRTSYNIATLQRDRRAQPAQVRGLIDDTLEGVAAYFRQCVATGRREPPSDSLLARTDAALLAAFHAAPGQVRRSTLDALVGVRRSLFPMAPGPLLPGPGNAAIAGTGAADGVASPCVAA